ncbi:hypothetical protein [Aureimonas phyllosphaerae]|uniref:Uncharacterized protein n=1 Tax=Aureimonas phyllosphaerae TaxID=1166078 RepID=A0A7W6BVX4_9HYPH|nr:hypothetical protein [Aureimonas phyllosphaerae]MBB3937897.1 hypothetical protein [Aureimonas phyllosphaerae]MBB3961930.1 hypothetical protein [Aureimonas phyllosphaerae]SFF54773.1 hypothetical protein SAMN05216566_12557 [Aureimonas phyllosphaerae]
MRAAEQIPLFDLGAPPVTAQMRKDLAKLEAARPWGMPRFKNDWRTPAARITGQNAAILRLHGLARTDYEPRTPALKITPAGRRIVAAMETN